MKNEIKALAELKQHCVDNPTQLTKLLEYKHKCQAFDWSSALMYIEKLEDALRFYGDEKLYAVSIESSNDFCGTKHTLETGEVFADKGQRAREALKDDK